MEEPGVQCSRAASRLQHPTVRLSLGVNLNVPLFPPVQVREGKKLVRVSIYITESLIDLTRAKGIAGNGCHGHVHLSVESQAFEPVEASFRKLKKLLKTGVLPLEAANM